MTATEITAKVLAKLGTVRRSGAGWMALCPEHADSTPSLSVTEGDDGRTLLKCQAGCETAAVLAAIGLGWPDLFPASNGHRVVQGEWTPHGPAVAVYEYGGFQVLRAPGKRFIQRRPDPTAKSGWSWNLKGVERHLYRDDRLPEAIAEGRTIYAVEGEKDVHALEAIGEVATANPGGAGKWRTQYAEALTGAAVVVIADNDDPGLKHAQQVATSLAGKATVRVVRTPLDDKGADVSDHLAAGMGLDELVPVEHHGQDGHVGRPAEDSAPQPEKDAELQTEPPTREAPAEDSAPDPEQQDRPPGGGGRGEGGRPPPGHARLVDGAAFILDQPTEVPAIWGEGQRVLWAHGEGLALVGPVGTGKTTLTGQLVRARIGLQTEVLGFPVVPSASRVLYLACDRPPQIARSMRRIMGEEERDVLADRLVVWKGPPEQDLARHPEVLTELAVRAGADTVVIDSLKDVAIKLTDDEVGAGMNRAVQMALVEGIETVCLHHQRKATGAIPKPKGLEDVYGSVWLTAGMGSVILLWGAAGDPIVELSHLKQPAEAVGPLKLVHGEDGTTSVLDGLDVFDIVRTRPGTTVLDVAKAIFETTTPSVNEKEKARRRLDRLVPDHLHREDGKAGGDPARYFPRTRLIEAG